MRRFAILMLPLVAIGCGGKSSEGGTTGGDAGAQVLDVRVAIPAADPSYVDVVTPEETIPAGSEKLFCYYVTNKSGELAVDTLEGLQGKYGHHLVVLESSEAQPDGTVQDCTDLSTMSKYKPFVYPGNPLPAGDAVKVPANFQFVVQFHYVNSGSKDLLVRDVARLHKVDPSTVTTWVNTLAASLMSLSLPAGQTTTSAFDCTIPSAAQLLLIGGHMHGLGTKITVDRVQGADSTNIYSVDPWEAAFRDDSPVSLFFTNPFPLSAGDVLHVSCSWNNTSTSTVTFPSEMCAAFGYIAGANQDVTCQVNP